jgi:hypothetical protein
MAGNWAPEFIRSLTESPNVAEAARRAGVARRTPYARREVDPDFAAAWDEAVESATDDLAGEGWRRAKDGCEKPVFYQGGECGRIREYSDTLLIFLLKAHRPTVYRETVRQEHTGKDGGPIEVTDQARAEAARELEQWRKQMSESLPPAPAPPAGPSSS